jgi:hypothetical protein
MNPIERAIRRVDAAQQRHTASALVFGIIKKYGDDNGGVLAAIARSPIRLAAPRGIQAARWCGGRSAGPGIAR